MAADFLEDGGSLIDPATLALYQKAYYRLHVDPPIVLLIGQGSVALEALHSAYGVTCSAFITACNPLGQRYSVEDNQGRQRLLRAELQRTGYAFISAAGEDPDGAWPPEPSFLVFGLDITHAQSIGTAYEQNAIVWCAADAVPQLILLR